MQVNISIGQNCRVELREALLIYGEHNQRFVTKHDVTLHQDGPPSLGPAQPLTLSFVEALVRSLHGSSAAEVLPKNILAKTDRMISWWTPARCRQMFYANAEGKAANLNGCSFPQPPLVWRVEDGGLAIRALQEDDRPDTTTKLSVAPFWNLSSEGNVCTGSMRRPDSTSATSIADWEQGFYESAFTHANVGRLTRHEGGFEALWQRLVGRETFPLETLIGLPQTLSQFICGSRSPYAD